jgi:hypothetical protein
VISETRKNQEKSGKIGKNQEKCGIVWNSVDLNFFVTLNFVLIFIIFFDGRGLEK